jgi:hypothetical protein
MIARSSLDLYAAAAIAINRHDRLGGLIHEYYRAAA